ncbi:MAG: hypothetical protein CM15mP26_2110 [Actinomycetota bacterium]|nr:MAG: hypothetical protein CM15mP26_2110 [Actinomycetota bacterium]
MKIQLKELDQQIEALEEKENLTPEEEAELEDSLKSKSSLLNPKKI